MKASLQNRATKPLLALIVPALLVLWWDAQATGGGTRANAFAPVSEILATLRGELADGQLLSDSIATLSRAMTGLLFGGMTGILLGVAMAIWRPVDRLFGPLYTMLRQVPLLGWLPLIGLWLGNGDGAKLVMVSMAAFYPTVLNSYEGVAGVEKRYLDVAHIYGFTGLQRFHHVLLPAAAPLILTGISQALAFAWIATIGSELLLGSGGGLGAAMSVGQVQQRMDLIMVAIIATALIGFVLNQLLLQARHSLLRWQPVGF